MGDLIKYGQTNQDQTICRDIIKSKKSNGR